MTQSLSGKSVLIVEDEFIIGLMLNREIARVGGTSIGPVASVSDALKEIESRPIHAAVIDAKLADGTSAELASSLEDHRIPYVVVSGYDKASLPTRLRSAPFIAKPVSVPLLMEAIHRLSQMDDLLKARI
ncbi:MAG: hypothetical protein HYX38_00945 [Rhodospirillales bacterium]|nr:hypothetical protein [Rhodospirillales bacterium]